jgi:hypothetical protein
MHRFFWEHTPPDIGFPIFCNSSIYSLGNAHVAICGNAWATDWPQDPQYSE